MVDADDNGLDLNESELNDCKETVQQSVLNARLRQYRPSYTSYLQLPYCILSYVAVAT